MLLSPHSYKSYIQITSALTKRPPRSRPIGEGAVVGAGPMKFTEGPDGDETKQSSVNQKLKSKNKSRKQQQEQDLYNDLFSIQSLRDEKFTGILSCYFVFAVLCAGKKGLIAILFLSSRESYGHAYKSEEQDYVISLKSWV